MSPVFSCLHNWVRMTTICLYQCRQNTVLLDLEGAIVVGIFMRQLKGPFLLYPFSVSSIQCWIISWPFWYLYHNLSVWSSCAFPFPTLHEDGFAEKSLSCSAFYREHATFVVWILNYLRFRSKIQTVFLKMCFDFGTACHTHCLLLCA